MKTYLTYGGISAIATAVIMLVAFLLGYQTTKMDHAWPFSLLSFVVPIVVLYFGMKDARESRTDKCITYGQAVVAGLMISVFAGIFGAIYTYVHFGFINTDYAQYMGDLTRTKMEAAGKMTGDQIDTAIQMQAKFLHPAIMAAMTVVLAPIIGVIEALILAIFIKRNPEPTAVQSV